MIGVGLYGNNGHQIQGAFPASTLARVVAVSGILPEKLPVSIRNESSIQIVPSLDALLNNPEVDFISLCSPLRHSQAQDAIRALRAGKHVLAEKPCAMSESDLDEILDAAKQAGKQFHEMAGTAFYQPYSAMREIVRSKRIGEVVQVIAEKSYPFHEGRPQDENVDGGLIAQNSIHALRFVEHVACKPIESISAVETSLGNPVPDGGLRMAACLLMTLHGGGVATISANYLNPRGTGIWGNEALKISGTNGFVETRDGGSWTRLVVGSEDLGALDTSSHTDPWFWLNAVFLSILGRAEMPISLSDELSPTRWAIRARQAAQAKLHS